MSKALRKQLDTALKNYIKAFEKKHDVFFEFTLFDYLTGVLNFGDYYFSISDIVYDIDNKLPLNLIFEWQDAGVQAHFQGNEKTINLQSYSRGLRYESI